MYHFQTVNAIESMGDFEQTQPSERGRNKGETSTYVASDVVLDNTLLFGHTAGFAAGRDAEGAGLGDGVGAYGGVGRIHVLGEHCILVALSHAVKVEDKELSGCGKDERDII